VDHARRQAQALALRLDAIEADRLGQHVVADAVMDRVARPGPVLIAEPGADIVVRQGKAAIERAVRHRLVGEIPLGSQEVGIEARIVRGDQLAQIVEIAEAGEDLGVIDGPGVDRARSGPFEEAQIPVGGKQVVAVMQEHPVLAGGVDPGLAGGAEIAEIDMDHPVDPLREAPEHPQRVGICPVCDRQNLQPVAGLMRDVPGMQDAAQRRGKQRPFAMDVQHGRCRRADPSQCAHLSSCLAKHSAQPACQPESNRPIPPQACIISFPAGSWPDAAGFHNRTVSPRGRHSAGFTPASGSGTL